MGDEQTFYGFREKGERPYQSFALELVAPWRCQLRCKNCYKGEPRRGKDGEMPAEFVDDAMRQARECGFAEVIFMGGEPTLHPALPEFVRQAIEIGLTPIVVSNGVRLANREYSMQIALPGTTLVLHALLPALVQDEEAQAPGYNHKIQRAYANVLDSPGVTIVAEVVAIHEFLPHIPDMYRRCREKGAVPFIEMNRRTDDGVVYAGVASPEEVHNLFKEIRHTDPHPPAFLTPPAYGQACTMSITGVHVKNFGSGDCGGVYSCCAQGVRHGDLHHKPLAEILRDPSLLVFKNQDQWIYGPCQTCEYYSICRGGCRGEAHRAFGCPRASTPFCWHIPHHLRKNPSAMVPTTCAGCPLEGNAACHPRRYYADLWRGL